VAEVVPRETGVRVRGEIIDSGLKTGVSRHEVAIEALGAGRRQRFTAATDAHGRFDAELPLASARFTLRFSSEEDERYGGAPVVESRLDLTKPIPRRYLLLPLAATALLVLSLGLARARALGSKRPRTPRDTAAISAGLRPATLGRFHALRPRDDHVFGGVLLDAQTQRPVAGAVLTLALPRPAEARRLEAGPDGRFSVELPDGRAEVAVAKAGYLTLRFAIEMPHRGELRGSRVELMPVRVRVLEAYREVALGLLPDHGFFQLWTPREILNRARHGEHGASGPLRALTALVDETYYSGRPADEGAVGEAERLAAAVRAEAAPGPSAAP
jgi:hypothetical protein